jgi:hypothetical protein
MQTVDVIEKLSAMPSDISQMSDDNFARHLDLAVQLHLQVRFMSDIFILCFSFKKIYLFFVFVSELPDECSLSESLVVPEIPNEGSLGPSKGGT